MRHERFLYGRRTQYARASIAADDSDGEEEVEEGDASPEQEEGGELVPQAAAQGPQEMKRSPAPLLASKPAAAAAPAAAAGADAGAVQPPWCVTSLWLGRANSDAVTAFVQEVRQLLQGVLLAAAACAGVLAVNGRPYRCRTDAIVKTCLWCMRCIGFLGVSAAKPSEFSGTVARSVGVREAFELLGDDDDDEDPEMVFIRKSAPALEAHIKACGLLLTAWQASWHVMQDDEISQVGSRAMLQLHLLSRCGAVPAELLCAVAMAECERHLQSALRAPLGTHHRHARCLRRFHVSNTISVHGHALLLGLMLAFRLGDVAIEPACCRSIGRHRRCWAMVMIRRMVACSCTAAATRNTPGLRFPQCSVWVSSSHSPMAPSMRSLPCH